MGTDDPGATPDAPPRPAAGRLPHCGRCGRTIPSLVVLAQQAAEARAALASMRLAMPDSVRAGLEALASALPCLAATCTPRGER
jgi:hypothetical protein